MPPRLIHESTGARAINAGVELVSCGVSLFGKLVGGVIPALRWAFSNGFQVVGALVVFLATILYIQRTFDVLGSISCLLKPELCAPMGKEVRDL